MSILKVQQHHQRANKLFFELPLLTKLGKRGAGQGIDFEINIPILTHLAAVFFRTDNDLSVYTILKTRIKQISDSDTRDYLRQRRCGLEKESLRVNIDGKLSQLPHPVQFGSALTHPYITTDYSEALLELVTPALDSVEQALKFLKDTHKYVYDNLDKEILWGTSMPCIVSGEKSIPIAFYGNSNQGQMKTIYRHGLANRYGSMMQVIAGIHFNYSYADEFWQQRQIHEKNNESIRDFTDQGYFGQIRNIQRYGWLIPYLFGASPAVCRSFVDGLAVGMEVYDDSTYFQPYATSLRMGDIGYQNYKEGKTGIKANYNNIDTYVRSLTAATTMPSPRYQSIGIKVNNEYRQLNDNILQIENEYYSSVRPKQITTIDEKPSLALQRRGVQYVELRSLDINVFEPMGISLSQLHFLEIFMLFCALQDSPRIRREERREIDINQSTTAHRGREPGLRLQRNEDTITLKDWALELMQQMQAIASLLDETAQSKQTKNSKNQPSSPNAYQSSLSEHVAAINNPERTPSARMLNGMNSNDESFHAFSMRYAKQHQLYFNDQQLPESQYKFFKRLAVNSSQAQSELERNSHLDFEQYLHKYYHQT